MIKLRGNTYHAAIYHQGKKVWRSLKTDDKREAKIRYGKLLEKMDLSTTSEMNWYDFKDKYLAYSKTNHSATTYERDKITIDTFTNITRINKLREFTNDAMEQYKTARVSAKKSPATINRELGTIKAMARRAMEWKILDYYDLRAVKKLKETRKIRGYFELDQINLLRDTASDIQSKIRVDLALYTGFRRTEMTKIEWGDIDFKKDLIHLKSKPGFRLKNYEERTIKLHPVLRETLLKWQPKCKGSFVLNGLRPAGLYWFWKRLLKRAKLQGSTHTTRHTFATHLVRNVGSTPAKDALGHSTVKTTERYSHQNSALVPVEKLPY